MMKKVFVVFVVLLLMSQGLAEEVNTGFVFMEELTWKSTIEEVTARLGEHVQRIDDEDETVGSVAVLTEEHAILLGTLPATVACMFYNDDLCRLECYYSAEDVDDFQAIRDTIAKAYGELETYSMEELADDTRSLGDLMMDTQTLARWTIDAVTEITVIQSNREDSAYKYYVLIENTKIMTAFEEALENSMAE